MDIFYQPNFSNMNLKLYFLVFLGIIFSESSLFAQHVTEAEALQKAQAFMKEKIDATGTRRALRRMSYISKAAENDAFYIFNAEDGDGFVIVSSVQGTILYCFTLSLCL